MLPYFVNSAAISTASLLTYALLASTSDVVYEYLTALTAEIVDIIDITAIINTSLNLVLKKKLNISVINFL